MMFYSLLQWGSNKHLLAVNTIANVFMLNEQVMSAGFKEQVSVKNVKFTTGNSIFSVEWFQIFITHKCVLFQTAVVQYGPSSLSVEVFSNMAHHDLKTDIQVKGIFTTKVRISL